MACPRYDWKPAHRNSRFCKVAKQRLADINTNLRNSKAALAAKKKSGATKQQLTEAERRFATWYIAARASKTMYCRMCSVGCKKKGA